MNHPRISAVVTNYNYARYLPVALKSVLDQRYQPHEVVVVDDGSTDGSRQLLETYGTRLQVIHLPNRGQGAALNAAARSVTGDLVAFLDADDYWSSSKLQRIAESYSSNDSVAMIRHNLELVDADAAALGIVNPGLERTVLHLPRTRRRVLVDRLSVPTSGLTISREAAAAIFPIPEEDFRLSADAYLYVEAGRLGRTFDLPEVLGAYRIHGDNGMAGTRAERLPKQLAVEVALLRATRRHTTDVIVPAGLYRIARELGAFDEIRSEVGGLGRRTQNAFKGSRPPWRGTLAALRELVESVIPRATIGARSGQPRHSPRLR